MSYLDFLPNELINMVDKFAWIGNEKLDYREIVLKELLEVVARATEFKRGFYRLTHLNCKWKWEEQELYFSYNQGWGPPTDFHFETDVEVYDDFEYVLDIWTLRTTYDTTCNGSFRWRSYIRCKKYKTTPHCDWSYKMWPETHKVPFSKTKKIL